MKEIIDYLIEKYNPEGLILYGSYQDGTYGEYSDFDGLLICDKKNENHDDSRVNGVQLDVFIYTAQEVQSLPAEDFVQVYGGCIILDQKGTAQKLLTRIREYIDHFPLKKEDEIKQDISWCKKMLLRAKRNDAEGFYRRHWLLTDSLMIYSDVKGEYYFGPKKTLAKMKQQDEAVFTKYVAALENMDDEGLEEWVACLSKMCLCN